MMHASSSHILYYGNPSALIVAALLLTGCKSEPTSRHEPKAAPVVPDVAQTTGAAAAPKIAPQKQAPKERAADPVLAPFTLSMLTPDGLWDTQVEDLDLVKSAFQKLSPNPKSDRFSCQWEPLQHGEQYEWTWMSCYESKGAYALFRITGETWKLLKFPKSDQFWRGVQEGCYEYYKQAREHVNTDGKIWLIWSWVYASYIEDEEFIDLCEDDGSCSSGRTGKSEMSENIREYDIIIQPDSPKPFITLRSQIKLKQFTGTEDSEYTDLDKAPALPKELEDSEYLEQYKKHKGSRLNIEVLYNDNEVQATYSTAKIQRGKLGKAKLVKKTKDKLTPVNWKTFYCH